MANQRGQDHGVATLVFCLFWVDVRSKAQNKPIPRSASKYAVSVLFVFVSLRAIVRAFGVFRASRLS